MTRIVSLVLSLALALAGAAEAQTAPRRPIPKKAPPTKPAPPTPAPPVAEAPPPPPTDVKLVTAFTQGAQVSSNTTYIRGARQRVEFPGMVSLDQCDLKRTVMLSPASRRYRVQPYPEQPAPAAAAPAPEPAPGGPAGLDAMVAGARPAQAGAPKRGGVITVLTTLVDTLERETMFGLEARRIKTVMTKQASSEACDKSPFRMEIDAWYVDLPRAATAACGRPVGAAPEPAPAADGDGCQDRVDTRVAGDVTLGFPLKTTATSVTGEGDKQETSSTVTEVTALEITRLDEALFDIPADYVEAHGLAELAPSMVGGGSLSEALFGSTADGTSSAAPKKAGITRIGVLEPTNRSAQPLQPRLLRQELVAKFSKGSYEALPLNGSSASAIAADAARLECDFILLAEVTEVKASKPGRMSGMMKSVSGGGPAKDTHEVKVAYRLFAVDATAAPRVSGEVKGSTGGFSVGSALRVAAFAGQLYLSMGGMGMMLRGFGGYGGMGMGMMSPMTAMANMGGLGSMGGSLFDPRSSAMSAMAGSLMSGMGGMGAVAGLPGAPDASDADVQQALSEAFGDLVKSSTEQLKKKG